MTEHDEAHHAAATWLAEQDCRPLSRPRMYEISVDSIASLAALLRSREADLQKRLEDVRDIAVNLPFWTTTAQEKLDAARAELAALRAKLDAAEARAARLAEALAPVASEIADAADTDTRWEQVHHALADADSGWLAEHDASVRRAVLAEVVSSPQLRIEAAKAIARHLAQFEHDILYGTAARSHDDAKEGEK